MSDTILHELINKKMELLQLMLVESNKSQIATTELDLDGSFDTRHQILSDLIHNDHFIETREKEIGVLAKKVEKRLYSKIESLLSSIQENNQVQEAKMQRQQQKLDEDRKQVEKEFEISKYLPTQRKRPQITKAKPTGRGYLPGKGLYQAGANHENTKTLQSKHQAL